MTVYNSMRESIEAINPGAYVEMSGIRPGNSDYEILGSGNFVKVVDGMTKPGLVQAVLKKVDGYGYELVDISLVTSVVEKPSV